MFPKRSYEALKTLYRSHGARSVSDMARLAMQQVLGAPHTTDPLQLKVDALDRKVDEIGRELTRLENRLEAVAAAPEGNR